MQYKLTTPCTAEDLAPLKAGDTVLLSGVVYTARDQAHKRMLEALDKGEKLPFDLEGSAIYYVGPTPERPGEIIGSAGPTTSGRMDAMSPRLLDLGNKIMIGKGKRDAAVLESGGGLVSPACDQKALADNMLALYRMADTERAALGAKAKAYYTAHYRRAELLKRLEEFTVKGV